MTAREALCVARLARSHATVGHSLDHAAVGTAEATRSPGCIPRMVPEAPAGSWLAAPAAAAAPEAPASSIPTSLVGKARGELLERHLELQRQKRAWEKAFEAKHGWRPSPADAIGDEGHKAMRRELRAVTKALAKEEETELQA